MLELYKLYKLSLEYSDNGNYAGAEFTLQQMIHLKTELLGRNYVGCGFDLYNLGLINGTLKRYDRARRFLIRALQIQKEQRSPHKLINVPETLKALADLRRERLAGFVRTQQVA